MLLYGQTQRTKWLLMFHLHVSNQMLRHGYGDLLPAPLPCEMFRHVCQKLGQSQVSLLSAWVHQGGLFGVYEQPVGQEDSMNYNDSHSSSSRIFICPFRGSQLRLHFSLSEHIVEIADSLPHPLFQLSRGCLAIIVIILHILNFTVSSTMFWY